MFKKLRDYFMRSARVATTEEPDPRAIVPEPDDPNIDPTAVPEDEEAEKVKR